MHRTRLRITAISLAVALPFGLAACGGDDEADETTTTTEATAAAGGDFLAEIDERGKPTLEATDPVEELVIIDDVDGTGAEVEPGDTVTAHYVGVAATTGEEFDSSWDRGEPSSFPLDQVIQGWTEGLVGMKEGGRRTLVIPAEMAYGDSGPAPGDSLVFTVDLVAVN